MPDARYPRQLPSLSLPLLTSIQGYKNQLVFLKIVENRWNRTGPNLKTAEFIVSKFQKKIKISKIYVKKID
jgi:hypothetical protein